MDRADERLDNLAERVDAKINGLDTRLSADIERLGTRFDRKYDQLWSTVFTGILAMLVLTMFLFGLTAAALFSG